MRTRFTEQGELDQAAGATPQHVPQSEPLRSLLLEGGLTTADLSARAGGAFNITEPSNLRRHPWTAVPHAQGPVGRSCPLYPTVARTLRARSRILPLIRRAPPSPYSPVKTSVPSTVYGAGVTLEGSTSPVPEGGGARKVPWAGAVGGAPLSSVVSPDAHPLVLACSPSIALGRCATTYPTRPSHIAAVSMP